MQIFTLIFLNMFAVGTCLPIFLDITSGLHNLAAATASKATQSKVTNAANSFAGDVATVSNSINKLATTTDTKTIKSLATTGFKAEQDEDQHRAILSSAAGTSGNAANSKIVQYTPVVLDGLSAIMKSPSAATVKKTLPKVSAQRYASSTCIVLALY